LKLSKEQTETKVRSESNWTDQNFVLIALYTGSET
jgi:hypothetical protein